jgi:hemerythrin-like domain-containing protein
MKSIMILMDEHQLILRALRASQLMTRRYVEEYRVNASDVKDFVTFVEQYADTFHHKKEEEVLFRWMQDRGFPIHGGPIEVMLYEHDIGRSHIASLKKMLEEGLHVEKKDIVALASLLGDFSAHLGQHIFKEDNILYPMAQQLAEEKSDADLLSAYAKKISDAESFVTQQKFSDLVGNLEKKYAKNS